MSAHDEPRPTPMSARQHGRQAAVQAASSNARFGAGPPTSVNHVALLSSMNLESQKPMKTFHSTIALLGLLSLVACRGKATTPALEKGNEPAAKPPEGNDSPGDHAAQASLAAMMGSFADIAPEKGEVEDRTRGPFTPGDITAESIHKGIGLLQTSFYFRRFMSSRELTVENDRHLVPGGDFVTFDLRWIRATTKNKKDVLAPKSDKDGPSIPVLTLTNVSVKLSSDDADNVQRLEGTLTAHYPNALVVAELPATPQGIDKPLKTVSCRLLALKNDVAAVRCSGLGNGVQVLPLSASGRLLEVASSKESDEHEVKFVVKAAGRVAKVIVAEPEAIVHETVKIEAFRIPDFGHGCPKIPMPRYASTKSLGDFPDLDEATIRAKTRVEVEHAHPTGNYEDQWLEIHLPKVRNSGLAEIKIETLKVSSKGEEVPVSLTKASRHGADSLVSIRLDTRDGKAVDIDAVEGSAEVKYPIRIGTRKILAKQYDPAITIASCYVRATKSVMDWGVGAVGKWFLAYAANGSALKDTESFESTDEYSEFRFWGTVAEVAILEAKEWKTFSLPFSIKPPKTHRKP